MERTGPPATENLLKVEQVCAWFNVTKDWVYDEVEADRLPCVRLGRRTLRFDPQELRAYLSHARGQAARTHPRPGAG